MAAYIICNLFNFFTYHMQNYIMNTLNNLKCVFQTNQHPKKKNYSVSILKLKGFLQISLTNFINLIKQKVFINTKQSNNLVIQLL